jgi:hypothetical protein
MYPAWRISNYLNQNWWTEAFDPNNNILLPFVTAVHNLPNLVTPKSSPTDILGITAEMKAMLSSPTKIRGY